MNKEQVYDTHINPLMAQIIELCRTHKIGMLATFDIPTEDDEGLACTTHLPDETGKLSPRIAECVAAAKASRNPVSPLILTTVHADGSKTIAAVLD